MYRPYILHSLLTIYPDPLNVMGWRITSSGFGIVLSRDIPTIDNTLVAKNVSELLGEAKLPLDSITHFIAHPGGMKVMEAYQHSMNLHDGALKNSLDILREYGNMSSATVLFILERFLQQVKVGSDEYGIISALG